MLLSQSGFGIENMGLIFLAHLISFVRLTPFCLTLNWVCTLHSSSEDKLEVTNQCYSMHSSIFAKKVKPSRVFIHTLTYYALSQQIKSPSSLYATLRQAASAFGECIRHKKKIAWQVELEGIHFNLLLHGRVVSRRSQITFSVPADKSLCLGQSQEKSKKRAGFLKRTTECLENNPKSTEEEM